MNNAIYFPAFGDVEISNNVCVNPANGSVAINGVEVDHYGLKQDIANHLTKGEWDTYHFLKYDCSPCYRKVKSGMIHSRYVVNNFIYDLVEMIQECENASLIAMQSIRFSR